MKKTNLTLLILVLIASLSFSSCKCCKKTDKAKTDKVMTQGTVKKLPNMVGACAWVIETAEGKKYEPKDLPADFLVDGQKIEFTFDVLTDMKSKCMTGTLIRVTEVKKM